jgi:hypothetical protein
MTTIHGFTKNDTFAFIKKKMSIATAQKLSNLAISPIASYAIESIWTHLKKSDF